MNRNRVIKRKNIKKTMVAALTGLMVFQSADFPVLAEALKQEKEETVYAKTDADGNISEVIVSDWLKNPEKKWESLEPMKPL